MQINIRLFAGLAELFSASTLKFQAPEAPLTAGGLKALLAAAYPEAAQQIHSSLVAIDHEYAPDDTPVTEDSEVALIPPVSGGEPADPDGETADGLFIITGQPLNAEVLLDKVLDQNHGASLVFVGTTREMTGEQRTTALHYEAYTPMALAKLQEIGNDVRSRWNANCAIAHRTGLVGLKEASVIIAVSAAHRDICYEASRYAIERLKADVPVWKKDINESGEAWLGSDPKAKAYKSL
ncbi:MULTISPECIES: molybdenum cofactor biosynthesis protein MoaE [unclassified Paenibacillus]|uniref:molybdenum cofactor biosynthesis protein n=1 Tax=unclassified Paenibacillus TaxID=185978 RepID=UPI002404E6FB|nr:MULTISPECIES: molybdenum cofactor biosynthesis protein MoaE [unclassified Paenibacillus]MDF9841826.1 molybdopterin converting factor subunit 1 [Paenibacillus sp. PastF-2]MDF9848493.1 molybdopterin converting factor subunit 1 [Paenibacillus sp. PastM-2]MDF9854986.1 molybdopterin converting factor subunit 1 [Paenibacillus sp. PastF-1]MDH6480255.1 molybdopterin converting factor subunit 1 [Paenibacillus sp. PastH-2]MDH6507761.1 molybdopterin converting factor subunit 1 [Paenibacillus sp. PastM